MRRRDRPATAWAHPVVLSLLMVGLFVSSFYLNCLEHTADVGAPGHHGAVAFPPSDADDADGHAHAHHQADGHAHEDSADGAQTEDPSEPCHHSGHGTLPSLALGTACDRCSDLAILTLPEPETDVLASFPHDLSKRPPHWSRIERPPTSLT